MAARGDAKKKAIIVFCAHSDDQVLGAGGTMAKYAADGAIVHTVIFSFGELSHPWLREEVTADMRAKESEDANKILGGNDLKFLGLKEGKFAEEFKEKNMFGVIHQIITELEPDMIFTHSIDDIHRDHKDVNRIVREVVKSLGCKCDIYAFEVWNIFRARRRSSARLYVDVSGTFALKIRALNQFRSQWLTMLLPKWAAYIRAFIDGAHNECRYAESFEKVK
jgi:N-acetylglucosamine malate deacetylase 1